MKKVLVIYNYFHHYRAPVFESLGEQFDLTVIHSEKNRPYKGQNFNEIVLPVYKLGPILYRPGLVKTSKNHYDFIIILSDLRWVSSVLFFFLYRKKRKIILWGNWFTKSSLANRMRLSMSKKAYSNVFYDYSTKREFVNSGVNEAKCFVANNSVKVRAPDSKNKNELTSIIAVGSLHARKRIDLLIQVFIDILPHIPANVTLDIIGSGVEEANLKALGKDHTDRVIFHGQIRNQDRLRAFYQKAICHVSFGQAGLSVLQSLGNATPFLTKKDSITGGERYNIVNNYNGFLLEGTKEDLKDKLILLSNDLALAKTMGDNALQYYNKYCSITNMVHGFVDSMEFTQKSTIDERI